VKERKLTRLRQTDSDNGSGDSVSAAAENAIRAKMQGWKMRE